MLKVKSLRCLRSYPELAYHILAEVSFEKIRSFTKPGRFLFSLFVVAVVIYIFKLESELNLNLNLNTDDIGLLY